jgi:2-octaprenyl-6-methoxyphenol hydroxylase
MQAAHAYFSGMAPSTETADRFDCCIVGGGMVGASLAAALGSAGLSTVLIDRADPVSMANAAHDSRTTAIAHGSKMALDAIGAWADMAAGAAPILDIRISDGAAPLYLHFDHAVVGDAPMGYIAENHVIRQALYDRLQALDAVALRAPAAVQGVETDDAGVTVRLDTGDTIMASLLVGADGAASPLRERAGIRCTRWQYNQTAIVCNMRHERPHRGIAHERFLPAGPFAVLPLTDGADGHHRSSIVWTEKAEAAPGFMALDDDAFSAELGRRFGPHYGAVAVDGDRAAYPLRLQHAERYIGPRLALVGDAAHVIHPIAGQGWNLGLRDIAALAEVVVDARRLGLDVGAASVLARYQRWRRFDNVLLAGMTDGLNRLFSNDIPPVRTLRDLGLGAVNNIRPLKRFFIRHAMGTVGQLPRLVKGEAL